jgi:ATP-dependent helicase/nuclease subunit B
MLSLITGPFNPQLETALLDAIEARKSEDLLGSITIVVPSDTLRRHLQWKLCVDRRLALLNLHILTFYQLALTLVLEAQVAERASVRSEFFFQELVHHLLLQEPESSRLAGLHAMPGAWGALLSTLRDLKDARVQPDLVYEGLSQTQALSEATTRDLFRFYGIFLAQKDALRAYDEDDLAAMAAEVLGRSPFLTRQQHIFYYGFYDLTQVQLDVCVGVAKSFPTTLCFPLVKGHPAYAFAQAFFERHIQGLLTSQSVQRDDTPEGVVRSALDGVFRLSASIDAQVAATASPEVSLLSVSGPRDEVDLVAKDIVMLVEERGYAFHEIGVVARSLVGYETILGRAFDDHGIPRAASFSQSLAAFPYTQAVVQLLEVRTSNVRRETLLGLVSSPCFRFEACGVASDMVRPDLWARVSQRLGIVSGMEEWGRLKTYVEQDLPLTDEIHESGELDDQTITGPVILAVHVANLWAMVVTLAEAVAGFPAMGTWEQYVAQLRDLCERFFTVSSGLPGQEVEASAVPVHDALFGALDELRYMEALCQEVSWEEFAATLHRLVQAQRLAPSAPLAPGVQVLDVMAARGLSFRALYLLGMNEKVFPRHIQEDPFLRDTVRRTLEIDLGYKIQEKLAGYQEEKLLFFLACDSASERLTLLCQRADCGGRSLVPSGFFTELAACTGALVVSIPKRLIRKCETIPQYQVSWLTARELLIKTFFQRRVPLALLEGGHSNGPIIARGLPTMQDLERSSGGLGPRDGTTGSLATFWEHLRQKGVSPSSLETYALCPFRYFARYALELEESPSFEVSTGITPADRGQLIHRILRVVFERLGQGGYWSPSGRGERDLAALIEGIGAETFSAFATSHSVGYALLWELEQRRMLALVHAVLQEDVRELDGGWEPVLFEAEMKGALPFSLEESDDVVALHGRVDRVDWSRATQSYRVIDYKVKLSSEQKAVDKNLRLAAVRGQRLQPPLYLLMAQATVPPLLDARANNATLSCEGVWFYYLAPAWERPLTRERFPGDAWVSDLSRPLEQTFRVLLQGIHHGQFVVNPSEACEACEYRGICRSTHVPTLARVRSDAAAFSHRALKRTDLPKSPVEGEGGARQSNEKMSRPRKGMPR